MKPSMSLNVLPWISMLLTEQSSIAWWVLFSQVLFRMCASLAPGVREQNLREPRRSVNLLRCAQKLRVPPRVTVLSEVVVTCQTFSNVLSSIHEFQLLTPGTGSD